MFCPKCGSILIPRREGEKIILTCSCGHKSEDEKGGRINESVKRKASMVEVVHNEDDMNTMPKMSVECPKCHNNEAHFWEVQTRAADEPATKFLKCTKCKHTWRDYN